MIWNRQIAFVAPLAVMALGGMASSAQAQSVAACSGSSGLNYNKLMTSIAEEVAAFGADFGFEMTVLETAGSLDNAERYAKGECALFPAQPEVAAITEAKPEFTLWPEFAHFICRQDALPSGADEINEVGDTETPITVGGAPKGSGSRLTWDFWVEEDPDLMGEHNFKLLNLSTADSIKAMTQGIVGCTFFVSGLNPPYMDLLDVVGANLNYVFVELDDRQLDNADGYDDISLDDAVYPSLMSSNTTTVAVTGSLYIDPALADDMPLLYAAITAKAPEVIEEMRAGMVND